MARRDVYNEARRHAIGDGTTSDTADGIRARYAGTDENADFVAEAIFFGALLYANVGEVGVIGASAETVCNALAAYANAVDAEVAADSARQLAVKASRHVSASIATNDIDESICHLNAAVAASFAVEASYQVTATVAPNLDGLANYSDPDAVHRRSAAANVRERAAESADAYAVASENAPLPPLDDDDDDDDYYSYLAQ
jgi:hypothetical protein